MSHPPERVQSTIRLNDPKEEPVLEISATMIKELREKTGAGMLDCREALKQNEGNLQKAMDFLRQKGIASADKKKDRATAEGRVDSYIHAIGAAARVGVLIEVNCETDFVAKTDDFKNLVRDVAMHIAALSPVYVTREEVPKELIERELDGYKKAAIEEGKKPEMAEKIAQGKVDKYFERLCLYDQPYVKDDKKTVGEYIRETIGKLGENIKVARFVRYALGESAPKE
ncbi:MAG: translation elongation factor Ts [Proteobacteria bacterium]|nr:translation elongation factor Ts [Pseudomonadota bacterium]